MPASSRIRSRAAKARRKSQTAAPVPTASNHCHHCGHPAVGGQSVKVEPRGNAPDVGWLWLCASCVEGPERTWRLRYRVRTPD